MSRHSRKVPKVINTGPKPTKLTWKGSQRALEEHATALIQHPPRKKVKTKKIKLTKKQRRRAAQKPKQPPVKKFIPYDEYLRSKWWKSRRKQALNKAGYCCECCGATDKPLDVHHKNYERLGREKAKDLEVLCRPCHDYRHSGLIAMNEHLSSISRE